MLTEGWLGLATGYAAVAAPMLVGMIRSRASYPKLLLCPLLALPVMALAASGLALAKPLTHALGMASGSILQLLFGSAVAAGIGYFSGTRFGVRRSIGPLHQRGALVVEANECARGCHERGRAGGLRLAGIALAAEDETKHFKFIGTTGTGKSTAIREVLGGALARGDRAMIADPEGGYLRRFYDAGRGDVILNPFVARSVKWSLLGEIKNEYDVEQLARALIPDDGSRIVPGAVMRARFSAR